MECLTPWFGDCLPFLRSYIPPHIEVNADPLSIEEREPPSLPFFPYFSVQSGSASSQVKGFSNVFNFWGRNQDRPHPF